MSDDWINDQLAAATEADEAWLEEHRPLKDGITEPPPPVQPPTVTGPADDEPMALRNELADADVFVQRIINKAIYCPQRASTRSGDEEAGWLVWDGTRWRPSEDGAIQREAKACCLYLSAIAIEEAEGWGELIRKEQCFENANSDKLKDLKAKQSRAYNRADQLQSEQRMLKIISLARIDQRIIMPGSALDADPDLLNCPNGIVHLPTGDLHKHDPRALCSRITAVPYDPKADRSLLTKLLERLCMQQGEDKVFVTDPDRIRYLQDAVGHALYGHQRLQQFYLLIGDGGDGKGTLFEALLDALGGGHDGYAMKADMQSFVKQKMSGHRIRDDLANMAGARLVIASEINKGDAFDGALVKTLSGEDTQRVRQLYGREFEFRPICTMFMMANHEPYVDSQDHAIWRRLVKIPCGPPLKDHERDPAMRAALHDPRTGGAALLAWAIEGAKRTHGAKRLATSASIEKATAGYRSEMDPLAGFIIDDLRFAAPANAKQTWVAQRAIVPAFQSWQQEEGLEDRRGYGISGKRIGAQLRACGAYSKAKKIKTTVGEKTLKVWYGVTLRKDHELYCEHCGGVGGDNHHPSDDEHYATLATSGAIEVTRLPQEPSSPDAPAENTDARARGIFSSHACELSKDRGYQVTDDLRLPELDFTDDDQPPF